MATDQDNQEATAVAVASEGYNGWKNYPTWCVNLWLSNDEPLYREALERTEGMTAGYEPDQYTTENVHGRAADMFKQWVRDELAPDLGASFAADLLGYALDCVDWYEIADSWVEQVSEQVAS